MSTTWSAANRCGKPRPDTCCEHDCTSGTRNRYFTGKRLTPDALRIEQEYQTERRRLINRAVHGWGVVYGYRVAPSAAATGGIAVGAGLAFDRMGRELVQTGEEPLALDDMLELAGGEGDCYLLRVHYAEQWIAPVSVRDACSCERQQWDHVCETVRYSLQRVSCAECCDPQACGLECACGREACGGAESGDDPRSGARQCICAHLAGLPLGAACHALAEVSKHVRVDLHNGVPLACLTLGKDECDQWRITGVSDACGPRRLVKRNDLLFDLIRGCDLTRIQRISWAPWHRSATRIPWDDFNAFFAPDVSPEGGCVTRFSVEFSRPVRRDTLAADCFRMTFLIRESEGGWLRPMLAPIVRVIHGELSGETDEWAATATLVVSWGWVGDALRGPESKFTRAGIAVDIEIRGDFILDCNGQAVDADARGRSPGPSGNGAPGGTFRSSFVLDARPPRPDPDAPTTP